MKRLSSLAAAFACAAGAVLLGAWAPAAPGKIESHSVAYGQVKLQVFDQGAGPAVIMIPSLGRGASDFDDLAARVSAAGYRVLRLQPRGIGDSVGPMTGLSLHDLATDVAQAITASGVKQAVVLGHDDGNRIARATAAYFPQLVSAVVLVGAGGKVPPEPAAMAALSASFDPSLPPDVHLQKVAAAFFAPGHDPSAWRGGWYGKTAQMERAAGAATPTSDWWTAGSAPLLVVQGDQDRIAPPGNADLLKADVGARAEVVHINGAGHALLPEQPRRLAEVVIDYLKRHAD